MFDWLNVFVCPHPPPPIALAPGRKSNISAVRVVSPNLEKSVETGSPIVGLWTAENSSKSPAVQTVRVCGGGGASSCDSPQSKVRVKTGKHLVTHYSRQTGQRSKLNSVYSLELYLQSRDS